MNELIITVSGKTKSGKSRLTYLLKNFLREQGFEVELNCGIDYQNENDFDKSIGQNFDEAIENIKESSKITMNEIKL